MLAHKRHGGMGFAEDIQSDGGSAPRREDAAVVPTGQVTLTVHHRMEPLERAWRQLEADPWNSLHQGYDWCHAWAQTHGNALAIVEGRLDGELAFLLPLEIERRYLLRRATFIASSFTNFNSGLFSAAFRNRSAGGSDLKLAPLLLDALRPHADLLCLNNVPLDWRGERHPLAALPQVRNQNASFQLKLAATMEETIAPLNAKSRRKKYRTQVRKLEAAGGFDHIRPVTHDEQQALLECFFEQKAARFANSGLPDAFHEAETQAFFHMLLECDKGSSDVALELHAIRLKGEHDGKISAIAGLSRKGDHVICQFGSIDDSLMPEASPGELLFWLVIERSVLTGATLFDFGIGDQDYKRRWCTEKTVHHDILLPLGSAGRIAAVAHRNRTKLKTLIKANPRLYALIQRLRARGISAPVVRSND